MRRAIAVADRLFTLLMIVIGAAFVGAGSGSALVGFGAFFLGLAAYNAANLLDRADGFRYPRNPRTGDDPK